MFSNVYSTGNRRELQEGFSFPPGGGTGLVLALAGGEVISPLRAGPMHPPFSLFIPGIKRENGPCTVQKRKTRGCGLRGRGGESGIRQACPCPRRSASGGFGGCRIDKRQFWCGAVSAFFPEPPFYRRCCRRGGPMCPPVSRVSTGLPVKGSNLCNLFRQDPAPSLWGPVP